jgi:hypothetical protein
VVKNKIGIIKDILGIIKLIKSIEKQISLNLNLVVAKKYPTLADKKTESII